MVRAWCNCMGCMGAMIRRQQRAGGRRCIPQCSGIADGLAAASLHTDHEEDEEDEDEEDEDDEDDDDVELDEASSPEQPASESDIETSACNESSQEEDEEDEELDEDTLLARLAGHTASRRAVASSSSEEEDVGEDAGGARTSGFDQNVAGSASSGAGWDDWGGRRRGKGKGGGKRGPKAGGNPPAALPKGAKGSGKGEETRCGVCGQAFASRTKLFAHINAEGHAQAR